jgi:hypothetical protein
MIFLLRRRQLTHPLHRTFLGRRIIPLLRKIIRLHNRLLCHLNPSTPSVSSTMIQALNLMSLRADSRTEDILLVEDTMARSLLRQR